MPNLKYKDPVTGEYKSDIHVVGAVSSVNGKTGVVELTNSDIPNAITDVLVNGASVVADGVANVPIAGDNTFGAVKTNATYGIWNANGMLYTNPASVSNIDARSAWRPIVSSNIDYAVKAAMCDGKGAAWTPAEQAAARERMGAHSAWHHVHLETAEEVIHMNAVIDSNATELIITGEITKVDDSSAYVWIYPYVGSGDNAYTLNRPGPFTTQRTVKFLADGYLIGGVARSIVSSGIANVLGWLSSGFIGQFRSTGMIDITFGSVKMAAGSYVDIYYR